MGCDSPQRDRDGSPCSSPGVLMLGHSASPQPQQANPNQAASEAEQHAVADAGSEDAAAARGASAQPAAQQEASSEMDAEADAVELMPPPDPSEGPEAAAEYEAYMQRWQQGTTLAQRWARLAASGKLPSIQADWEDLQLDLMLQASALNKDKAAAAASKRGGGRRARAELEALHDAALPEGRRVRCRTAPKMYQDFHVDLPTGMAAGDAEPASPAASGAAAAAAQPTAERAAPVAGATAVKAAAHAAHAAPAQPPAPAAAAAHGAPAAGLVPRGVAPAGIAAPPMMQQAAQTMQQLSAIFHSSPGSYEGFMQFAARFQNDPAQLMAYMQATVNMLQQQQGRTHAG